MHKAISRRFYASAAARNNDFAHCIIGGGVVGLAVAAKLVKRANAPTIVLERRDAVGTETSSRNSEVIHAGIYYPNDSLKTELCIKGKHMLYELCEKHNLPHKRIGKWIVAQDESEGETIQKLYKKCKDIGVAIEHISQKTGKELEPEVNSPGGIIHSPTTGIFSSHDFMLHLQGDIEEHDGEVVTATAVTSIENLAHGGFKINCQALDSSETFAITSDTLINSAGLGACDISNLLLPKQRHIKPYFCKGNYFSYSSSKAKVNRLIYPCPVAGFAGLGTHVTLDLAGRMRFGPDVEWIDDVNDLQPNDHRLQEATEQIARYLPNFDRTALVPDYCGIRPKLGPEGSGFQDFVVRHEDGYPGFINLLGIESPGLTSSLAIAERVHDMLYK